MLQNYEIILNSQFSILNYFMYLCSHEKKNRTDIPVTAGQRAGQLAVGLCGVLHSTYDLSGRELESLFRQSIVVASDGDATRRTDV